MTIQEIEQMKKDLLNAEDVAAYLCVNPQTIRSQAQREPEKLGFPVIVLGSRVLIPRLAFISFIQHGIPRIVV